MLMFLGILKRLLYPRGVSMNRRSSRAEASLLVSVKGDERKRVDQPFKSRFVYSLVLASSVKLFDATI